MVICPRCKSEDHVATKSWDVIPKSTRGRPIRVTLYKCNVCGNKYRKATKLEASSVNLILSSGNEHMETVEHQVSTTTEPVVEEIPEPATAEAPKESFFAKLKRAFAS